MSSLFDLLAPISSILPLLVIALFGLVLMVVEAIWRDQTEPAMWSWFIFLSGLVAAVFLFVNGEAGPVPEAVRRYLAADRMAYFFDIVICGGALLSGLLAGGYLREHELERGEF